MSINNFVLEEAVEQLVLKGYCKVPFKNRALVNQSQQYFKDVLKNLANRSQTENWSLEMPGESESDLGLIPPQQGKDIKWFFHYNLFLSELLEKSGVELDDKSKKLLAINRALYLEIYELASQIVAELEFTYEWSVLSSFQDCIKSLKPYATSTMRSLWYPGVSAQKGAKPHIDRSLLSIHLGDQGGDLIRLLGPNDNVGEIISPGPGEAVVFPGVKALWASNGKIKPLWHKSTTIRGEDRRATVSFWHIEVPGYQVVDALEAQDYFYREVRPALAS